MLSRVILLAMMLAVSLSRSDARAQPPSRLIVVTLDGMRWQEIFEGADRGLITGDSGGVADTSWALSRFWRASPVERRFALMPFFWSTIGTRGQIWGDSSRGSPARVTNGKRFSYPGYNELFTGRADDRITSNDKVPNPNRTVLEELAQRPPFRHSIEIFGSWDVFPFIFNIGRSALPVNGDGPPFPEARDRSQRVANQMAELLPDHWRGVRLDAPTMAAAIDALRSRKPRILVVLLGETDEWAHERRYDLYLDAARRADRFVELLWREAQALPEYAGRTTLLMSTDHGRGAGRDWPDHGVEVPAAERIWMAALGRGVEPRQLRTEAPVVQGQFAETIFELMKGKSDGLRPLPSILSPVPSPPR
jgi:hypothetical protein